MSHFAPEASLPRRRTPPKNVGKQQGAAAHIIFPQQRVIVIVQLVVDVPLRALLAHAQPLLLIGVLLAAVVAAPALIAAAALRLRPAARLLLLFLL